MHYKLVELIYKDLKDAVEHRDVDRVVDLVIAYAISNTAEPMNMLSAWRSATDNAHRTNVTRVGPGKIEPSQTPENSDAGNYASERATPTYGSHRGDSEGL